jgi:hypothetical protein
MKLYTVVAQIFDQSTATAEFPIHAETLEAAKAEFTRIHPSYNIVEIKEG